jgi:hypothetical protein
MSLFFPGLSRQSTTQCNALETQVWVRGQPGVQVCQDLCKEAMAGPEGAEKVQIWATCAAVRPQARV